MNPSENCQCSCGETRFHVEGAALIRAFCHCEFCQEFNQAPFGDITLFHEKQVKKPDDSGLTFRSFSKPAMVQRGACTKCEKPAIEYVTLPLLPRIVIVPTGNIQERTLIPPASLHAFYHRRQADIDDTLPKYSGFLSSQVHFTGKLIAALLRQR